MTAYVMLELMLTRPRERKALITSAKNLSFLVLTFLLSIQQDRFAALFLLVHKFVHIIRGRRPRAVYAADDANTGSAACQAAATPATCCPSAPLMRDGDGHRRAVPQRPRMHGTWRESA